MRVLWSTARMLFLFVVYAPQLIAIDYVAGEAFGGVGHGAIHLYYYYLQAIAALFSLIGWGVGITAMVIFIWVLVALGLNFAREVSRQ